MIHNVVSMSGGKDSTAMALLAIERGVENPHLVFADTGHEHAQTYEYVDYLEQKLSIKIDRVKADFSRQIEGKRRYIAEHWLADGVPQEKIDRALAVMHPTGNPFLDLCLWKGRFPSTRARFCSTELKNVPLNEYCQRIARGAQAVISWQGVRRQESAARRNLTERDVELGSWEPEPRGFLIYRPILDLTVEDVFAMHRKHGVDPNPLYLHGMSRVGCMPCIHARKDELRNIAMRFPEEIDRVFEWERIVSEATKRGTSCLIGPGDNVDSDTSPEDAFDRSNIRAAVDWSRTSRGGKQRDLIHLLEEHDVHLCSSQYGLCE